LLQASPLLGESPEEVTAIKIEPLPISTGIRVSDAAANAVGEAVEVARRELAGSGA
jgi:hypothetical protein